MKVTVYRYGIYAGLVLLVLNTINFFVLDRESYGVQEAFGYLVIFVSMIFVFLGIRHYRDHVNGGVMSFGKGLKVGVLILLVPSVFFGLFDLLYTHVINPDWSHGYFAHYVEQIKATTPPEKLAAALKQAEAQKELFSNPILEFLIMAATVFIIGFIVSIISSLTLMRKANKKTVSFT
jgi:hypothetical protein